jgi:AraC-like DNA-binding protein
MTMGVSSMATPPPGVPVQNPGAACNARRWRRFLRGLARPVPGATCKGDECSGKGFRLGPLAIAKTDTCTSHYVRDGASVVRGCYRQHVLVLLVLRGSLRGKAGNRRIELRRGDIGFLDLAHDAEMRASEGSQLALVVPRAMLQARVHGLVLRESQLACRMLTRHLEQLVLSLPAIEPARVETLVEATMAVVQLCLDFSPAPATQPPSEPQRAAILDYIEANLDDVELTPERIARRFGLSRTRLYQLFLGSGGIKRWIRDKRLDATFRDLCEDGQPRIIDIAYRHGFSSERQFQRAFLARFGATPSAVRDRRKRGGHGAP